MLMFLIGSLFHALSSALRYSTLRKLIDDGSMCQMDANDIWRLVRQIIEALVYIHKRKIIHRDLVSVLRLNGCKVAKSCLG